MRHLLGGLDVGTSAVKAVLITADGTEVALGRASTAWTSTTYGAETTAASILDAAHAALADALSQVPEDRVSALGIASMAESGVLVDGADEPLAPVIAWHDHRDKRELDDLVTALDAQTFSARTGLPVWTQWSLTKHRWLVDNLPASRDARRRYNIAEWVARSLGAEPVTELSLASRTGWLDLATAAPWRESMQWSGAPESLLHDLVAAGTPIGSARTDGALRALNGATVTIAGHDHQAAVVGVGSGGPGAEFDSCGTAEAFVRTISPGLPAQTITELTTAGVTVGWHAIADRWCLLGATQGGLILGRVQQALGIGRSGLAALDRAALAAADQPEVLRVTDDMSIWIDGAADPGVVWRAAVRQVTSAAQKLGEVLDAASGPRRDLVVAGGWTNSAALMDAKRKAFGALRLATTAEAGARGAAIFAGLAAGTYASLADAPGRTPEPPMPTRTEDELT